jgi:hypothetical protein
MVIYFHLEKFQEHLTYKLQLTNSNVWDRAFIFICINKRFVFCLHQDYLLEQLIMLLKICGVDQRHSLTKFYLLNMLLITVN